MRTRSLTVAGAVLVFLGAGCSPPVPPPTTTTTSTTTTVVPGCSSTVATETELRGGTLVGGGIHNDGGTVSLTGGSVSANTPDDCLLC